MEIRYIKVLVQNVNFISYRIRNDRFFRLLIIDIGIWIYPNSKETCLWDKTISKGTSSIKIIGYNIGYNIWEYIIILIILLSLQIKMISLFILLLYYTAKYNVSSSDNDN